MIITCYYVPEQDMLNSEECDGESLETSMPTANHAPTEPVHWGAGAAARLSQSGFLVQRPHPLSYSLLWPLLVLHMINWVNLLSRQRAILSAVVGCRGSVKG